MPHTQYLYQQITNQIIEALDQTTPWALPWHQKSLTLPRNVVSQKTYTGVNVLSLWIAAHKNHYTSSKWGTYKQWQGLGAQVRKGEKGHLIVFYKHVEGAEKAEGKNEETDQIKQLTKGLVLKSSIVFNASQVELVDSSIPQEPLAGELFDSLGKIEDFVTKTGSKIIHSFNCAFYHHSDDIIWHAAE